MSSSNVYKKVGKTSGGATTTTPTGAVINSEIQKNEIRITAQGRSRNYISYAVGLLDPSLLQKEEAKDLVQTPTEPFDTVVLKAMGKAIQKAVTIAEVLKRRVAGLHQITSIESQEIEDQYEPKEEGMDVVTKKRTVSSIVIQLSKKALDTSDLGYQPPIPADQVTAPQIIPIKKVPGVGGVVGGEGGAAGKRRRRKFRSGTTRKQQQQQTVATTTGAATSTTTTTTGATPSTTTTTHQPRVKREPTQAATTGAATASQQTGDVAQRGKSRPRGRGRGRGRGGNRGGRGQPRNTNATQSTGAATTTQQ